MKMKNVALFPIRLAILLGFFSGMLATIGLMAWALITLWWWVIYSIEGPIPAGDIIAIGYNHWGLFLVSPLALLGYTPRLRAALLELSK